jgi:signal transduction histidine kinase
VLWSIALCLPLVIRRTCPLLSLGLISAALFWFRYLEVPEGSVSSVVYFVSLVSCGLHAVRWRSASRAVSIGLLSVVFAVSFERVEAEAGYQSVIVGVLSVSVASNLIYFALAWIFGDTLRTRRLRERALHEQTMQLEAERETNARRAVVDERVRIARELHDVVAHHVSVMGLQAAGARRAIDRDPVAAHDALTNVERSSRQAIDELQRLVGFLRTDDDLDSLAPQPGLDRLSDLVDDARSTGLEVDVRVDGTHRSVPRSVDLSAYRIVQEALTNTRKHANARLATVTIRYGLDSLDIEIVDDGDGGVPRAATGKSGLGLVGMRERVSLHGGEFTAGPRRGRGYGTSARFPLPRADG